MSAEMEILNAVNSFYNDAFNRLLSYTIAIIALVGVLLPLVATLFQWRTLKSEKEVLERSIIEEVSRTSSTISSEVEKQVTAAMAIKEAALVARMNARIEVLEARAQQAQAGLFHLQGNVQLRSEFHAIACMDFCRATTLYLSANDELNLQRTLRLLIVDSLPHITGTEFLEFDIDSSLQELIDCLSNANTNARYTDAIRDIRSELKKARDRKHLETPAVSAL